MKKYIITIVKYIVQITLLIFIWRNSHWAVALAITLLSVTIELVAFTFVLHLKLIRASEKKINALHETNKKTIVLFENFVEEINKQADHFDNVVLNVCQECKVHGEEGIRMGSVHNKTAMNCVMNFNKDKNVEA